MHGKMSVTYFQGNRLLGKEPVFEEPSNLDGLIENDEEIALLMESAVTQERLTEAEYLGADRIAVDRYDQSGKNRFSKVFTFRR